MHYFYLHGLASSPQSTKAQQLRDRLRSRGISLQIPDLNNGDFEGLTVSRQIRQVRQICSEMGDETSNLPVTLVGSSLGGLTAAWVAQQQTNVVRVVLLAPAFGFPDCWLSAAQVSQWLDAGWLALYHYGEGRSRRLHAEFVRDARRYSTSGLTRPVPTTILHGTEDAIVPVAVSRDYARSRPWVTLRELPSDHALTDAMGAIEAAVVGGDRV